MRKYNQFILATHCLMIARRGIDLVSPLHIRSLNENGAPPAFPHQNTLTVFWTGLSLYRKGRCLLWAMGKRHYAAGWASSVRWFRRPTRERRLGILVSDARRMLDQRSSAISLIIIATPTFPDFSKRVCRSRSLEYRDTMHSNAGSWSVARNQLM